MLNKQELLEILLRNRGINKEEEDKFLNPSFDEHLYDPFLMKDMERTVVRIFEAIEAKEKIVIYSDYDCDGIPSAVMISDLFQKINYSNFSIYLPDRHEEGYGLHKDAVEGFIKDGVKLLVTFDLGITAINEVNIATIAGMDVIITDHHLTQENKIPKAYAIVNPKQSDCKYPDKMLCGAGVAFKLVQAFVFKYGEYFNINKGWEKWLLDLVAIATLSDQVPLLDENRVLSYYGLVVLRKGKRPGLVEIFKEASVDIKNLTEEDIAFTLAPRINAASRMSDPMDAFYALSEKDPKKARDFAIKLSSNNKDRKQIVAHIMKEVKTNIGKRKYLEESKPVVVIGNPKWNIGVLGIVASKIVEEYKMTAFVWGRDENGFIKGSGRSWGDTDLVNLLSLLPRDVLIEFGGHKGACGFTVKEDEIYFLEDKIVSVYDRESTKETQDELKYEAILSVEDVNNENYKTIEKLAPYGKDNPKPIFLFKNLQIFSVKEFGKEKNHLELSFKDNNKRNIKAIAFFKTRDSYKNTLKEGDQIDLLASIEKNNFLGKSEIRLRINDIVVK